LEDVLPRLLRPELSLSGVGSWRMVDCPCRSNPALNSRAFVDDGLRKSRTIRSLCAGTGILSAKLGGEICVWNDGIGGGVVVKDLTGGGSKGALPQVGSVVVSHPS
jgi:hypothetical protein